MAEDACANWRFSGWMGDFVWGFFLRDKCDSIANGMGGFNLADNFAVTRIACAFNLPVLG